MAIYSNYSFYPLLMQTPKKRSLSCVFAALFGVTSIAFLIHKIDTLAQLRFVRTPTVFYLALVIIALLCIKWLLRQNVHITEKIRKLFIILLPSALLFFVAINTMDAVLHDIFSIATGFYFMLLGVIYIYRYHQKYTSTPTREKAQRLQKKYYIPTLILVLFATIIHLSFGLLNIGKEAYVDEKLWIYDRIEQYWDNIHERDWKNTRPSDKPGVTTALASGPGLLFFDPTDFDEGNLQKDRIPSLFHAFRTPQFLIITTLILLSFFLVKKLLGPTIALFATTFMMLTPLLLGISRIINPDALLWIILFLCFLSFLLYLKKSTLNWIYIAGFFLGLALLTKYIANIFVVFFLAIILIDLIFREEKDRTLHNTIKNRVTHYAILLFTALSTFFILYPGVWVKHDRLLLATLHSEAFASTWIYFVIICAVIALDTFFFKNIIFQKVINFFRTYRKWLAATVVGLFSLSALLTLYNVYTDMSLFDFSHIIESPKSAYKETSLLAIYTTSFYPLLFGITPLVFLFSFFALCRLFVHKKWSTTQLTIFYGIIFILLYYVASTVNHIVPIVRYQIILYPFMILIASIGLYEFIRLFSQRYIFSLWISAALILIGTYTLITTNGFYFSYNSPLLPQRYIINSKDMGEGNYHIATYLNSLPNAHELLVWTDKRGVCQFFIGHCNNMIQDPEIITITPEIDYYIISQNRENYIQRLTQQKLSRNPHYEIRLDYLYDTSTSAAYTLYPSGRHAHYIKIIDATTINIIKQ